jgi:hypothetical protein
MAATISIGKTDTLTYNFIKMIKIFVSSYRQIFYGLTLNANFEMRELAKALSDESSACDALIEKTALHLKHLAELIDSL